jgi:hypothetical protein
MHRDVVSFACWNHSDTWWSERPVTEVYRKMDSCSSRKHAWMSELQLVARPWWGHWKHACACQAHCEFIWGDRWGVHGPSQLQSMQKYDTVFYRKEGHHKQMLQHQQPKWQGWHIGVWIVNVVHTHHQSHCYLTWSWSIILLLNQAVWHWQACSWFDIFVPGVKQNYFVTKWALSKILCEFNLSQSHST